MHRLTRRLAAEAIGTGFLVCAVVGSGIMAEALATDPALALLANTVATGAILVVLITILGPVSGAHLNPAVSLVFVLRRSLPLREGFLYALAQTGGGLVGTALAHLMFSRSVLGVSAHVRTGSGQWVAEAVAAFGLVFVILCALRFRRTAVPAMVGLYITSAYWFTASTSFANPAVTVARALTDSFAGIRPIDVPAFVLAQLVGAGAGMLAASLLLDTRSR